MITWQGQHFAHLISTSAWLRSRCKSQDIAKCVSDWWGSLCNQSCISGCLLDAKRWLGQAADAGSATVAHRWYATHEELKIRRVTYPYAIQASWLLLLTFRRCLLSLSIKWLAADPLGFRLSWFVSNESSVSSLLPLFRSGVTICIACGLRRRTWTDLWRCTTLRVLSRKPSYGHSCVV
jgi:hypothetical protein